ncbi:MAG: hypothetical protein ICV79_22155 [Flavisolibacter sp.]|nr:hypothetical protein [Flavisolibacter sp.]
MEKERDESSVLAGILNQNKNNSAMNKYFTITVLLTSIVTLVLTNSCKKERSCEGCNQNNKPPIAAAGPDVVITLPTDSTLLDGSKSSDPDGTISAWLWTKVSGPASFSLSNVFAAKQFLKSCSRILSVSLQI